MGFNNGPSATYEGLVLNLDAADRNSITGSGDSIWRDLSINAATGSLFNQAAYSTEGGGSISFDGIDDYVDINTSPALAILGDMSILSWINIIDYSTYNGIVSKATSNSPAPYDFYVVKTGDVNTAGALRFYRGNGTLNMPATSSISVPTGSWQHVAVSMKGTRADFYINGNAASGGTITTTIADAGKSLRIGNRDDLVTDMKGKIAMVQIFNRALDAEEIKHSYEAYKSRFGR